MRLRSSSCPASVLAALAAVAFVACASPRASSTTTMTAADLAEPAAREAPGEPGEAAAAAPAAEEAPPGRLECRATDEFGVTHELHLDWSGATAKGVLRRTTPSGMTSERPVRAERYKGAILADEPNEKDLMRHAAIVGETNGKRMMRVGGEGARWSACE